MRQRPAALETFLITSGECTVEEGKSDDETGKIMRFRRASNLVGEIDPTLKRVFGIGQGEKKTRAPYSQKTISRGRINAIIA